MTKHLKPEDRISEILEAAALQIDEEGYANLTMDKIVARTSLSKGGVYRFFKNKDEVVLSLYDEILKYLTGFDVDESIALNLSLKETLIEVIFPPVREKEREILYYRLWLHLLPLKISKRKFGDVKRKYDVLVGRKIGRMVRKIAKRDKLQLSEEGKKDLNKAIKVGHALVEGVTLELLSGTPKRELVDRVRFYLELIINEAIENNI